MKKVIVGISGGVDSSIAAQLLKEQGYQVEGLFMKNWDDASVTLTSSCAWEDDWLFAKMTAEKLAIPLHFVDLSEAYFSRVTEYMFAEYAKGRTPNPDVLCNREIKFDLFVKEALKLGADYVATGHYARKETIDIDGKPVHRLLAGLDKNKDQSYFLCQLSQEQLAPALFPIGHLDKPEVRRLAEEHEFATATRKDSQGICFIGKVDLPTFLQQKLKAKEGKIIEIPESYEMPQQSANESELDYAARPHEFTPEMGKKVGTHRGAHFYTIGQRKGLNLGGMQKAAYVLAIDVAENNVYVGQGHEHPGLLRQGLFIAPEEIHWIRKDLAPEADQPLQVEARIRYRQPLQKATLHNAHEGLYLIFHEKQRGITPGQFAAWYIEDELLGSGTIHH
ncbi:MAG: tRNA 2-thiouridine(34) synthase MnmA [Bacteroidales bacterium]